MCCINIIVNKSLIWGFLVDIADLKIYNYVNGQKPVFISKRVREIFINNK